MPRKVIASLTDEEYLFVCQFVYQCTGIVLNNSKREMVYRRLSRIVRERKLASFSEYCRLLQHQPEQELDFFINAITTNLTSFFREKHHFEYLKSDEFPKLFKQGVINQQQCVKPKLRVWSCACSTGEEPYSIAMTLHEFFGDNLKSWDAKILATDIDSNVLAKAKVGIYEQLKLKSIPDMLLRKYFAKGVGANEDKAKVLPLLQELITFKQLNLLHQWPMRGQFDVIFCRNVIIYFDKATQQDLFARFYQVLKPGGLLILGHSESLGNSQRFYLSQGRTIYRKPLLTSK